MRSVRELAPLTAATLLLLAVGCAPGNDPAAAVPEPPGEVAAPAPVEDEVVATPALAPVAGERRPGAHWVDSSGLLTQQADAVGAADVVLPFVHAVGDWLDAHLDDLQRGGRGRLDDVAAPGLLATATDVDVAAVTSSLTSAAAPVASAVYRLDATYEDAPEWLTATVEVTRRDGTVGAATLVFVPGPSGPELVLFGPAAPDREATS